MASYNGNIDLLSLNGAAVYSGIDQKNPNRAFVCIPVDLNEIKIEAARGDANKQVAKLRVNIWPLNEQYKAKVRQSAMERGDGNVNVPTHEVQLSFTAEYIKMVARKFTKLVEQVKEANKQRNPDIVNQDPTDESTHLFKAIRNRMNKRIATLYQPQAQPQQTAYPQSIAQAGSPVSYVPPVDNNDPFAATPSDFDDMPF